MVERKDFTELGLNWNLPFDTGDVFHLVYNKTTDAHFQRLWKKRVRDSRIGTSLSDIHTAMTDGNNDTVMIWPGDHVSTASLTWSKSMTRLLGCGGPNMRYQPSTLTAGGVRLSTVTSAQAEILNITGHYVQMKNIGTINTYSGASNLCDIKITGKNFYAEGCSFRGGNGATQVATDGAGVPLIFATDVAGGANAAWLKGCTIGSSGNTDRTKGPGCAQFTGGAAAGFGIKFEDCTLSSRISTASANNSCMIRLVTNYAVDRELIFKNCDFYNFVENLATQLDYCFDDECATTHLIVLDANCTLTGIDAWTNAATYIRVVGPAGNLLGGYGVAA